MNRSILTRTRRMLVTTASVSGMVSIPTSLIGISAFYFYHSILVCLHLALSMVYLVVKSYYAVKNSALAFVYHHHRTPQLIAQDIKGLTKLPRHVAVILTYRANEEGGGVQGLMEQVADVVSWSLGAGVSELTVYERTGKLDALHERTYNVTTRTLESYYGTTVPVVKLRTPHDKTVYPAESGLEPDLVVNFISKRDGREFMVELTRDLAVAAAKGELDPAKITVDLVDKLTSEMVISEPDLVVLFGPKLDLDGFPPWQVRLSEIYHAQANKEVTYNVFLRGLRRYSYCKINIGK
ncbi:Decaprenyl diphosphate synthase-like protein [Lipomyces arxii]|uniref:Decaprenyl diphosphate synthase-like protein n=1 Tax=Lipomyces arxii TaxID=56418 RepID=UPI0034CDEE68